MTLSRTTRVNGLIGTGHFLAHFYVLCLPPLFLAWEAAFHVRFAALGLVLVLMSATTAILQNPVGFLVDRHGVRYYLVGGAALMSLGIAAVGFVTSFWQILVCAVVSSVGNSVTHPANYTILSGSVEKDRIGRSFALHTFAGNVGFSAAPPIMALLLLAIGWRASLVTVGLVGVAVAGAMLAQSGILEVETPLPMRDGWSPAVSSGRLLVSGPILLFFGFYLPGRSVQLRDPGLADYRAASRGWGQPRRCLGDAHCLHGGCRGRRPSGGAWRMPSSVTSSALR